MTKKIAILVADHVNTNDLWYAYQRCLEEGWQPLFVGTQNKWHYTGNIGAGQITTGNTTGTQTGTTNTGTFGGPVFVADLLVEDCKHGDFDAVVIPDGYGVDYMRHNTNCMTFVRDMVNNKHICAAIGRGPALFAWADLVKGTNLTSCPTIRHHLSNHGCDWTDREVTSHGNLITARAWFDLPAFMREFTKTLRK